MSGQNLLGPPRIRLRPDSEPPLRVTPAPAAPRGPVTIALGQTTNQVVAMKGQSLNKVNFPNKMVYLYSDMKIIFVRGKVSDVQ